MNAILLRRGLMKKDFKNIYDEISVVYSDCMQGLFHPCFFLTQLNLQAVLPSFEFASDTVYFEICFRIMGNFSLEIRLVKVMYNI